MKKILVLNGPNLDMLGIREPSVYGHETLENLEQTVRAHGKSRGVMITCFQSNSESDLIHEIHGAREVYDGMVYNPGAHTHYSYALRDAVSSVEVPTIEVHLSDVHAREAFRRVSVIAPACVAQVKGRGFQGYCDAVDLLLEGSCERLGEGYEQHYASGQVVVGGRDKLSALQEEDNQQKFTQPGAAQRRLDRLRAVCAQEGLQAFYTRDLSNICWLTAFDGVFDKEAAHALLVTEQRATLHTDSRYAEAARKAAGAAQGALAIDDTRISHAQFAAETLHAQTAPPQALGVEGGLSLAGFRALEAAFADTSSAPAPQLRETTDIVLQLRAVKSAEEIARMRAAQAITDAAFSHLVAFMRPGMTEREVQIELEDYMRRHGAESLAFSSIVATGVNGASPHAIAGSARLEAGQCVVLDFGARAYGYCSDMTRMVFLGQPSSRMEAAYQTIRRANEDVQAALRPGVTGAAMHELAERVLAEGGFAGTMGHSLGHGVGINIHEQPNLSPRNPHELVEGNVVTIEPGIYLSGDFGMRLEDFGVVTHDGFAVFTQSTHDMVII